MLNKISFFYMATGLFTGCLLINNVSAGIYNNRQLAIDGLAKQERKITRNADTTLQDAESAFVQARHILLEDKNNSKVSDPEVNRLKLIVNEAALNLQRAQKIAGKIEGLRFEV